jgi:hypothetical protein
VQGAKARLRSRRRAFATTDLKEINLYWVILKAALFKFYDIYFA